jgi:hypothetical protein
MWRMLCGHVESLATAALAGCGEVIVVLGKRKGQESNIPNLKPELQRAKPTPV